MWKKNSIVFSLAIFFALVMGSCQTTDQIPALISPAASSITTEVDGFSPKAETGRASIDFALTIGNPELAEAWKVEIITGKTVIKTFNGTGSNAPSILTWSGKRDSGAMSPEGIYTAVLNIYYSATYTTFTTQSTYFMLDIEAPSGKLAISPLESVISAGTFTVPVTITIEAMSKTAAIESWTLEIFDYDGILARSFSDKWPKKTVIWDGSSTGGSPTLLYQNYKAVVKVRDIYGNTGTFDSAIRVAAKPAAPVIAQPVAVPAGEVAAFITPRTRGFSPNGDAAMDTIVFDLVCGQPKSVKTWKVDIILDGRSIRGYTGTSADLPSNMSWDGKKTDGRVANEGSYTATLAIDFGTAYKPAIAMSTPVILALSPPAGTVSLSESLYSPIESSASIGISIAAVSRVAAMKNWSMRIYDPAWNLFKSFEGEWPNTSVVWDGKGISGDLVESAEDYAVEVKVRDEFGNMALLVSNIPVDILVEETPTGYRILSSRIFFRAYTADYSSVDAVYASRNIERLNQLAEKLRKFPDYAIRIVGHAVMIYWDDPVKGRIEQEQVLLPLSAARAEAMAKAMISRGFDASKIVSQGVGADDQLVPDSDLANRWRNRRDAFFLEKP